MNGRPWAIRPALTRLSTPSSVVTAFSLPVWTFLGAHFRRSGPSRRWVAAAAAEGRHRIRGCALIPGQRPCHSTLLRTPSQRTDWRLCT